MDIDFLALPKHLRELPAFGNLGQEMYNRKRMKLLKDLNCILDGNIKKERDVLQNQLIQSHVLDEINRLNSWFEMCSSGYDV
jgi:hypothetical protein